MDSDDDVDGANNHDSDGDGKEWDYPEEEDDDDDDDDGNDDDDRRMGQRGQQNDDDQEWDHDDDDGGGNVHGTGVLSDDDEDYGLYDRRSKICTLSILASNFHPNYPLLSSDMHPNYSPLTILFSPPPKPNANHAY